MITCMDDFKLVHIHREIKKDCIFKILISVSVARCTI